MKAQICLFFACMLTALAINAQDVIIRSDGSRIEGKILERTPEFIIYKDAASGEKSVVSVDEIKRIEAAVSPEPEIEAVKNAKTGGTKTPNEFETDYGKNIIGINFIELGILFNFNISYERLISEGFIGIGVSYAAGLQNFYLSDLSEVAYKYINRYSLDINVYPSGQHRASYFIGPSIMYGTYQTEEPINSGNAKIHNFSSFIINNGVLVSISKNVGFSSKIGLGIVREADNDSYDGMDLSSPLFSFSIVGRF